MARLGFFDLEKGHAMSWAKIGAEEARIRRPDAEKEVFW